MFEIRQTPICYSTTNFFWSLVEICRLFDPMSNPVEFLTEYEANMPDYFTTKSLNFSLLCCRKSNFSLSKVSHLLCRISDLSHQMFNDLVVVFPTCPCRIWDEPIVERSMCPYQILDDPVVGFLNCPCQIYDNPVVEFLTFPI